MPHVVAMVKGVRELGLESCMTLGMLTQEQADELAEAGLDYYNHNLDTSPEFYGDVITTRTYQDRLETLDHVRGAGMKVCSGGIVGMGEQQTDRAGLLQQLANLPQHPESVPINMLVRVRARRWKMKQDLDPFEFIRTIAVARIMMPASHVRLSAGREEMNEQMHALAYFAGANSIFYGEKLLTTPNPRANADMALFARLGIEPEQRQVATAPENPTRSSTTPRLSRLSGVMAAFPERLERALARREQQELYRQRLTLESAQGPVMQLAGREYLNFCSNDYLGLAAHPGLSQAFARRAQYGVGSGASHLVCGHSAPHHQLEEALAEFTGRPRALLFSSGYMPPTPAYLPPCCSAVTQVFRGPAQPRFSAGRRPAQRRPVPTRFRTTMWLHWRSKCRRARAPAWWWWTAYSVWMVTPRRWRSWPRCARSGMPG